MWVFLFFSFFKFKFFFKLKANYNIVLVSLVVASEGYSLVVMSELLIAVASSFAEHGL